MPGCAHAQLRARGARVGGDAAFLRTVVFAELGAATSRAGHFPSTCGGLLIVHVGLVCFTLIFEKAMMGRIRDHAGGAARSLSGLPTAPQGVGVCCSHWEDRRDQPVRANRTPGWAVVWLSQSCPTSVSSLMRVIGGVPGTPEGRLVSGCPNLQGGSTLLMAEPCPQESFGQPLAVCTPGWVPQVGAIFCFTQRCRVNLIPSYTRHTWAGHVSHGARQCEHLDGPWRGLNPINTDPRGSQTQLGPRPTPIPAASNPRATPGCP